MSLGSGIRNKPIPDPGSRGPKDPYPGSRIRNTARYVPVRFCEFTLFVPPFSFVGTGVRNSTSCLRNVL
jgi:hypothetical protein